MIGLRPPTGQKITFGGSTEIQGAHSQFVPSFRFGESSRLEARTAPQSKMKIESYSLSGAAQIVTWPSSQKRARTRAIVEAASHGSRASPAYKLGKFARQLECFAQWVICTWRVDQ